STSASDLPSCRATHNPKSLFRRAMVLKRNASSCANLLSNVSLRLVKSAIVLSHIRAAKIVSARCRAVIENRTCAALATLRLDPRIELSLHRLVEQHSSDLLSSRVASATSRLAFLKRMTVIIELTGCHAA